MSTGVALACENKSVDHAFYCVSFSYSNCRLICSNKFDKEKEKKHTKKWVYIGEGKLNLDQFLSGFHIGKNTVVKSTEGLLTFDDTHHGEGPTLDFQYS